MIFFKKRYLFFFTALIVASSCTKNGGGLDYPAQPKNNFLGCRISQIVKRDLPAVAPSTYNFYYNSDGTVSRIDALNDLQNYSSDNNSYKNIVYGNGYILVNTTWGGSSLPSHTDSLLINGKGQIYKIYHNDVSGFHDQVWDSLGYNSLGEMTLIISHNGANLSTTNYQWKNGDVTWNTAGTDFYTYYYTDTLYNTGNMNILPGDFVNYGTSLFTPRHLPAMAVLDNGRDTVFYQNSIDASGRLTDTKHIIDGSQQSGTHITYADCN
jgi:hypothetical protein